jgi:CRISPR/Cas system-associated protein Cas10 (large subunit of type III CRISPR-Cas system)
MCCIHNAHNQRSRRRVRALLHDHSQAVQKYRESRAAQRKLAAATTQGTHVHRMHRYVCKCTRAYMHVYEYVDAIYMYTK